MKCFLGSDAADLRELGPGLKSVQDSSTILIRHTSLGLLVVSPRPSPLPARFGTTKGEWAMLQCLAQ